LSAINDLKTVVLPGTAHLNVILHLVTDIKAENSILIIAAKSVLQLILVTGNYVGIDEPVRRMCVDWISEV